MINTDLLLCWGAIHRKYGKGQTIFFEEDEAAYYYQVEKGKVKMVNSTEDGKEFIQGFFFEGDSFGEPPLFEGCTYPASAVAEDETTLLKLNKTSFLLLLKEYPEIHLQFTKIFAKRLRFKTMVSKEISCYGPEHRILTIIRHYKKNHQLPFSKRYKVDLTRQELADMTGLRVETVIRALRQLHDKGEVFIDKGKVYC